MANGRLDVRWLGRRSAVVVASGATLCPDGAWPLASRGAEFERHAFHQRHGRKPKARLTASGAVIVPTSRV